MLLLNLLIFIIAFLGGMVLHRWVARKWFDATDAISEKELFLNGLLASLIINGTIGTYLALAHLFYPMMFLMIFLPILLYLHNDRNATWKEARSLGLEFINSFINLDFLTIISLLAWLFLGCSLITLGLIPTETIDAWVYHLPIALSINTNHGFLYPQIDHLFFANQPLFMHVLFAQLISINPHYIAANLVNILIYLFMFISLAAPWKNRSLALLLLVFFIGFANYGFSSGVPTTLTDMPRSCLSVIGIVYIAFYWQQRIPYYLALAAMFIGAAIATKYTELLGLGFLGLAIFTNLNNRNGLILTIKCASIILLVSSYWYLKNWIFFNNPIYPFLLGHPGLSDSWMNEYMLEMSRSFDPAFRHFQRNLMTIQGWIDFYHVLWDWFFSNRQIAQAALILSLIGVLVSPKLIGSLLASTIFLFVFWYVVMFNHVRWAIPANMLMYTTGIYAFLALTQRINKLYFIAQLQKYLATNKGPCTLSALAIFAILWYYQPINTVMHRELIINFRSGYIDPIFNSLTPNGIENSLGSNRKGYTLYRYITKNDLRGVFQPYDNGVKMYAAAYNGGQSGDWFMDISEVPQSLSELKKMVVDKKINYFIADVKINPTQYERLGPNKVEISNLFIESLRLNSELIMEDSHGWKLYKITRTLNSASAKS